MPRALRTKSAAREARLAPGQANGPRSGAAACWAAVGATWFEPRMRKLFRATNTEHTDGQRAHTTLSPMRLLWPTGRVSLAALSNAAALCQSLTTWREPIVIPPTAHQSGTESCDAFETASTVTGRRARATRASSRRTLRRNEVQTIALGTGDSDTVFKPKHVQSQHVRCRPNSYFARSV